MTRTPFILKSLLLAILMPVAAMAGKKPDAATLTAISDEMYQKGNVNYIIADALRDGLFTEQKPYSYSYQQGVLTINGKPVPEAYRKTYEEKMNRFWLTQKGTTHIGHSVSSNKLRLSDMTNPESTTRRNTEIEQERIAQREKDAKLDLVVDEMVKDGLINDKNHMNLRWNKNGLHIDGRKLEGEQADKYLRKMEDALGSKPTKATDSYRYTRNG